MRNYILLLILLQCSGLLFSQQNFTISGTIKDQSNGETMIGVKIYPLENKSAGAISNEYGFYSLTLPEGQYNLIFSYMGYSTDTLVIDLKQNISENHIMSDKTIQAIAEVSVSAVKENDNLTNTDIGTIQLDLKDIAKIPIIFGEKDILKTIQLMPGVKSGGEGNSGFFVRGGSADQNLILLDEAPVYNASHLLGFFSTFNSDALKDVSIIKGNSPAQYGGRLSSVLDVKMKEGNNQKFSASGGIGVISSRLNIEGPIVKNKGSFFISGRRTYADAFLKLTKEYKNNSLYFYDINAKANYRLNEKNRIFISGYFGRDVLGFNKTFGIDWGNQTATLRWNSLISSKLFSNTSVIYNAYNYKIKITNDGGDFNVNSSITDWNLKQGFKYYANSKNTIEFGFNSIHHDIAPSRGSSNSGTTSTQNKASRYSWENAIYANNTFKATSRFTLDYGLRLSSASLIGGDTYNIYDKGVLKDSVVLASGKIGKTYFNIEPRLQFSFLLNEKGSLKGGYARNTQNLHLLSNSTSGTPTDQWIGNSYNIKSEISDQVSLGYFRNLLDHKYEFQVETYYKSLQNQIDYKNGADIQSVADVESELLYGKGRAYGLELMFKKNTGKFTGWVSYTLSKTERKIEGINDDNWYNARQDKTHDLSVVAIYDISKRWSISGLFVFSTGNAATFPSGKYEVDGQSVLYYTERNGYRMPNYHRLDIGATYTKEHKRKYESSWNFSIYNVYGRQNAYTITFAPSKTDASKIVATQTSLFRWIPSITYNFKF